MSLNDTRDALVAAVTGSNTFRGLITARYRQSLNPGDGCIRFASRTRDGTGYGWVDTWQVWLALSQDVAQAEWWLDEYMQDVVDALSTQMVVTTVTPAELVLGTNPVNGVIFEGVRES